MSAEGTSIRCIEKKGLNHQLHTALIATEHLSIFAHTQKNSKTTGPIFDLFKKKYLPTEEKKINEFTTYGKQGDAVPLSIRNFDFRTEQQLNRCFVAHTIKDKQVIGLINITPINSDLNVGEISVTLETSDQRLADEFLAGVKFFLNSKSEVGIRWYSLVLCSSREPMAIEAMRHNGFLKLSHEDFMSINKPILHRYRPAEAGYQEAYPKMKFEFRDSMVRSFTIDVMNIEWHDVSLMYLHAQEDEMGCAGNNIDDID